MNLQIQHPHPLIVFGRGDMRSSKPQTPKKLQHPIPPCSNPYELCARHGRLKLVRGAWRLELLGALK
ncbi:MAG: hypothetical protein CMO80_00785 [Verrucomicrobiales bacterium]|nr:hypothetical protein [Verrucomicrobiales bacterium]